MRSLLSLFTALMKNWLRSKAGLFFSFLFPVMLLFIFSTVFGGQDYVEYDIYVQNKDTVDGEASMFSAKFIEGMEASGTFNIITVDNEADLNEYFDEEVTFGTTRRGLIIPEGFHEKAMDKSIELRAGVMQDTLLHIGETYQEEMSPEDMEEYTEGLDTMEKWRDQMAKEESAEILLYTSEEDQAAPIVEGTINGVVDTFNRKIMGVEESAVEIKSEALIGRDLSAADYYLPAYIAAFIMTNGIIGVTSSVSEFKRNGVLKRLAATPLTKMKWILANVMQQTLLAFILTGVMIVIGVIFFNVQAYPGFFAILLIITGAVAFSAIGMVLGGFIKDVEAASGAGNAIAFPMMFLSGAFWSVEMMPEYLQTFARLLPLYHFHQGLIQTMILQNPAGALWPFIIILGFALAFIGLAVRITRWKEM